MKSTQTLFAVVQNKALQLYLKQKVSFREETDLLTCREEFASFCSYYIQLVFIYLYFVSRLRYESTYCPTSVAMSSPQRLGAAFGDASWRCFCTSWGCSCHGTLGARAGPRGEGCRNPVLSQRRASYPAWLTCPNQEQQSVTLQVLLSRMGSSHLVIVVLK